MGESKMPLSHKHCTAIQTVSLDECKAGVDPTQDINEDQYPDHSNEQMVYNAIEDQIGENLDLSRPFTVRRGTVPNEIRKWIRRFH